MSHTRNHCLGADLPIRAFQKRGPYLATLEGGGSGGGGSSNPDTRYANLDQLYGVQRQASQFMLDNAMPQVPVVTQNSRTMVDQAMDGTLAKQMREQAGNEATATMGAALDANDRSMQRYGMGFNANRLLSENNRNAIMGAATKAGAMSKANASAEDMKWNRNAGLFGQATGMNNGAMQGINSATAGMSNLNAQQTASEQKNAAGYGQAGSAFASSLFKAEGGFIEGESVRLASGGNAWEAYKAANPVQVSSGSSSGSKRSGLGMMLSGAAPQLLGNGLKDLFKGSDSKILKTGKDAYNYLSKAGSAASSTAEAAEAAAAAQASTDAGYTGAEALGMAAQGADYASSAVAAADAAQFADTASSASDAAAAASAASSAADAASAASSATDGLAALGWWAEGGEVEAQRLALGGLANNSVAKSNQIDSNSSVANMDASKAMSVAMMDDVQTGDTKKPTLAVQDNRSRPFDGNTDGMGESSVGDKDGFGTYTGDNRHLAGSAVMSYFIPGGGLIAKAIHPVMEPLTRTMISTGDKLGGVSGAMAMDPIGTTMSGKYKPEEIVKGSVAVGLGMPWLGKFLAEGGSSSEPAERADFVPGGEVAGPGGPTDDKIPAWLSDGEHVQNAVSTEIAGKDTLDEINQAGRDVRHGKRSLQDAQRAIGRAMLVRGQELAGDKPAVKLAGGGFFGGNMGIAMGAGVDEWRRQKDDTRRDQMMENQQKQLEWQAAEQLDKQKKRDEEAAINEVYAAPESQGMTQSERSRMAADALSKKGFGIASAKLSADANAQRKVEAIDLMAKAAMTGRDEDLAEVLKYQNGINDFGTRQVTVGDKVGIEWFDKASPEKGSLIGGRTFDNNFEAATALHSMMTGKPLDYLKLSKNDDNADKFRSLQEQRYLDKLENDRKIAEIRANGGGRGGNGSGGSGSGSRGGASEKLDELTKGGYKTIEDTLQKDSMFPGASKDAPAVTGLELMPIAKTNYSELLHAGVPPDRAAYQAIELAKSSKGIPSADYYKDVTIGPDGGYNVQVKNGAGSAETTLVKNAGNPTDFMPGRDKNQKLEALAAVRANAAQTFASSNRINVRELAAMTPAEIDKAAQAAQAAGKDGNLARNQLRNFVAHAQEWVRLNPEKKASPAKTAGSSSGSSFFQANPEVSQMADAFNGLTILPSSRAEQNRQRVQQELNPQ